VAITELHEPDDYNEGNLTVVEAADDTARAEDDIKATAPSDPTTPRPLRHSRLENLGLGLTLTGVVLLLFAGYLFGWSDLQAAHNQHRLLTTFAGTSCAKYNSSCAAEFAAFNGLVAPNGQAVAVLQIPAIGLRQVVVAGTTASDLQQGPGLMPATSIPGSPGEAVIAGRKLTFGGTFADIGGLRAGDSITIVDLLGSFRFVVESQFTVPAGQTLPVVHSNLGLLALVTSAQAVPPSGFEVVDARLVGGPVPAPHRPPGPTVKSELSLSGDSGAWAGVAGWGAALVLVLIGTVMAYRRTGRTLLVYVLSTPILLPVALFTFQNIARLLPATM
jgi:sortase A